VFLGAQRLCMTFGGETDFVLGRFKAKKAPTATACVP